MTPGAADDGHIEMRIGDEILRLHSRVVEVFSARSDYNLRYHVDTVAFAAREPDRHGMVKVQIGRLGDGEVALGSARTAFNLDPVQWDRFQAFVAVVKRVQAAGPEPW